MDVKTIERFGKLLYEIGVDIPHLMFLLLRSQIANNKEHVMMIEEHANYIIKTKFKNNIEELRRLLDTVDLSLFGSNNQTLSEIGILLNNINTLLSEIPKKISDIHITQIDDIYALYIPTMKLHQNLQSSISYVSP